MQQKSFLVAWRQVLAEVGLLEPPSEDERKDAAEKAEKLAIIRSLPWRRAPYEDDTKINVNEAVFTKLLNGRQKKVAADLMRILGRKELL